MISLIGKQMLKWALIIGAAVFLWALFSQAQAAEVAVQPVTLQDSLVSIIQQVQSGVSAGVSFLSAEIPDVIKQLLTWKFVEALVWTGGSLLLILQFIPIAIWAVKYHKDYNHYDAPVHIIAAVASFTVACIATGCFFNNGLGALQIYIAPKVWLIEYAASLVK